MKITHNKVGQNLNLSDSGKVDKSDKSKASRETKGLADIKSDGPGASKVELSSRAQDMKRIKDLANAAPDVDDAKVAKFQKMIDEGTYKVDSEAVADRMVDEHMLTS